VTINAVNGEEVKCQKPAGNFFFAGARLYLKSLEAAIFMFSRVARIPEGTLVLPVIRTEDSITLGAELVNGTIIRGQNQISHPPKSGAFLIFIFIQTSLDL
jgi:hypothetical protein